MANDVVFEGKERRMPKIEKCLADNGIESLEAARDLCLSKGIDVESIVKGVQPIAFDNAVWAYTLGVALAIKSGVKTASEASAVIGQGLQAFCVPGSVAEQRNVGLGHGNLGARLLHEDTKCFAFLAGHESFAEPLRRFIRLENRTISKFPPYFAGNDVQEHRLHLTIFKHIFTVK